MVGEMKMRKVSVYNSNIHITGLKVNEIDGVMGNIKLKRRIFFSKFDKKKIPRKNIDSHIPAKKALSCLILRV